MADINGTSGADVLNGTSGADVIYGLGGNDTINGQDGADLVYAGDGDDTLTTSIGPTDTLYGGNGNDHFFASRPAIMSGDAGIDIFTVFGFGHQSRILDFQVGAAGDRLDLASFADTNTQWNGIGNPFALGYLTLRQVGADVFIGYDLDGGGDQSAPFLYLSGVDLLDLEAVNFVGASPILEQNDSAGADSLAGTAALDVFHLGAGNDAVDGGRGTDTAAYAGGMAGYSVSFVAGAWIVTDIDAGNGDDGVDTLRNVEELRFADGNLHLAPGLAPGGPFNPAAGSPYSIIGTVAAGPAGGYAMVWSSGSGQVLFQRYDETGAAAGPVNADAFGVASTGAPGIDYFSDGGFVIVGQQLLAGGYTPLARLFAADGTPQGPAFQVSNGAVPNPYDFKVEVLSDDSFVVAWQSGPSGDRNIFARHYAADGTALGAVLDLGDYGSGQRAFDLVAISDDSFFLVRMLGGAVTGQVYAADGSAIGAPVAFNATAGGEFGGVALDRLADGRLIVTYSEDHAIAGRIFDPATSTLSAEFPISTTDMGMRMPDVAALDDGGFVVLWEANGFAGRYAFGQRFGADAARVGEEITVTMGPSQTAPSVAALPGGSWTAIWQDGSGISPHVSAAVYGPPAIVGTETGDTIHGGAAGDTIRGEGGDDMLFGGEGDDVLSGGADWDSITIAGGGAAVTADAGTGNDTITLGAYAGAATLTLGLGQDVLAFSGFTPGGALVVTDFQAGPNGDRLEWSDFLAGWLTGWDGIANPFATGHLSLVQSGADTLLQIDRDGASGPGGAATFLTFHNVTAAALIAFNLDGMAPPNDAPVIGNLGGDVVHFTEQGPKVRLDGGLQVLSVSDADSLDFDGGSLRVAITGNGVPSEDLLIVNTTFGVTISGGEVSVLGVLVGTISGTATDLLFSFNGAATPARIFSILRSFDYSNANVVTPSMLTRTITWTLTDGDGTDAGGHDTAIVTSQVTVSQVNDIPQLTEATDFVLTFTEGTAGVQLMSGAVLSDGEAAAGFGGGSLNLAVTGTGGEIVLRGGSAFRAVDAGGGNVDLVHVTANGGGGETLTAIGRIAGLGTASVTVGALTAAATQAMINDLIDEFAFRIPGDNPIDQNQVATLTFNDGGNGQGVAGISVNRMQSIHIQAINDAPAIAGLQGDGATFIEGGTPAALDVGGNALVTDADSPAFWGGSLRVAITANQVADEDVLGIANGGGVAVLGTAPGSAITVDGVWIGTIASGGTGRNGEDLVINLHSGATATQVGAIVHALTYANINQTDPTEGARAITVSLNDGGGTANGGSDTGIATTTANVVSVNDAPVLSAPNYAISLMSRSGAGTQGDGRSPTDTNSSAPAFSPDGTRILFSSDATNLVAGDTNGRSDIFIKVLATGEVIRVSTSAGGGEATGGIGFHGSNSAVFSPDGTKVAFASPADNLVPGDTNNVDDIFIKTLATGEIVRISLGAGGVQGTSSSHTPIFSPDGTKVAFMSFADGLVAGDTNGRGDIFIVTLATGAIERVSTGAGGAQGNFDALNPVFSPDGSKIAFASKSSTLVPGDTNNSTDIFVKTLATGELVRVSTTAGGGEVTGEAGQPVFSPDGTKIVFLSEANNLVPGDTNISIDLFMKDLVTGEISLVAAGGFDAAFSPDGKWLAFTSRTDLDPSINLGIGVYLKSLETGQVFQVSTDVAGTASFFTNGSSMPAFSPDGTQLVFASTLPNLVPADANQFLSDVFVATIGNLPIRYVEGGQGTQLIRYVTLADDGEDYDGGTLTIAVTAGGAAGDTLSLAGSGVQVSGADVSVNGVLVGTLTAASGSLSIALNAAAADATIEALIYAARFSSTSDNPTGAARTITFTLVDGGGTANGGADTASFTRSISVTPVNDAPAGADKTVTLIEDGSYTFTAADFGFSDVDGNSLSVVRIASVPAAGSLMLGANAVGAGTNVSVSSINSGQLRFVPAANGFGTGYTSFTFQVQDNGGTANGGIALDPTANRITFDVTGTEDPAVARNDALAGSETITLTGSLFADNGAGADFDPDGQPIAIAAVEGSAANLGQQIVLASGALLTVNADGSFSYDANHRFDALPAAGSGAAVTTATDTFSYTLANGGSATATVTVGGVDSNDTLIGTAGNDALIGGIGTDTMSGLAGNDTYYVDNAGDVVNETASQGNDRVATSVSYALAAGAEVETLEAVNTADTSAMDLTANDFVNLIIGNAGMNLIFAYGGNDQLIGNGGNDFLIGGTGADLMYGGTGNDTFYVDDIGDRAYELAGEGTDRIATLISYTLDDASEVELLESTNTLDTNAMDLTGSNSANQIIGNAGVNLLYGLGGNDQLVGLAGNDFLVGGTGADLMYGGTGNDTFYVDDIGDRAYELAGEGTADRIATSISYTLDGASEVELLEAVNLTATDAMDLTGSDSGQTIIGNDGVNLLFGAGGNDTLIARAGNDFLIGGTGDDVMHGGTGNDTYYVDSALDQANELAGQGNDRVATSVSYTLSAEIETLEAVNGADTSAINLTGNAIANTIAANNGANVLDGKGGNDLLIGYGGADTFAFTTALGADNVDHIFDFVSGTDKIALDDAIFGALGAGAFAFGTAAQDADDRIVYDSATGNLYFDADGNGSGAQVLFATLDTHPALAASDFTII